VIHVNFMEIYLCLRDGVAAVVNKQNTCEYSRETGETLLSKNKHMGWLQLVDSLKL